MTTLHKSNQKSIKVLFVCLGNICRSPCIEGIFRNKIKHLKLDNIISHDSAGTGLHADAKFTPDPRSVKICKENGIDISDLRSRTVKLEDFYEFDYILAMDASNLSNLQSLKPSNFKGFLGLIMSLTDVIDNHEVPDPYYGGDKGFVNMYKMLDNGCDGLIKKIKNDFSDILEQ